MAKMSVLVMLLVGVVALSTSSSATATVPCEEEAAGGIMSNTVLKTQTFVSPPIFLGPGSVSNKVYSDVDFPRGHVAIKSFNGELVDEAGAPVPLHETYLHHWLVFPYYYAAAEDGEDVVVAATNAGICKDLLGQYFGLGAETRRTATWVPDPYGIEIGSPPAGYEERWSINVHAIDTLGAADSLGCTECRCDLYNVTAGDLDDGYVGGVRCCQDGARCKVHNGGGDEPPPRKLFLRYTVTWLDWSDAVVPVRIYILDVTDTALLDGRPKPECKVEYDVEECSSDDRSARNGCVDVKVTKEMVPRGGDLVYGVGHLHRGGIGASLHGQDGRLLCASTPIYGTGHEAGDEAGYVVGMSTCYPEPGTVKVRDGEVLTFVSNYSSEQQHTGVMGHFYILLAEEQDKKQQPQPQPQPSLCFSFPVSWCLPAWAWSNQM